MQHQLLLIYYSHSTSTDSDGDEDDYEILSNVWSGQIGEREGVGAVFSHPISITFSVMKVSNHYIFENMHE